MLCVHPVQGWGMAMIVSLFGWVRGGGFAEDVVVSGRYPGIVLEGFFRLV